MNRTIAISYEEKTFSFLRSTTFVVLASFLIGLFAKVSIPFTPVPLTMQCTVILLLSALLGAKRAFAAVFLFLCQGAIGLPVFAYGGGFHYLFGPTGGYLFAYLAAAYLVGHLAEKKERSSFEMFWILAVGNSLFFLVGVPYLACFIGMKQAIISGFLPFIIGDILKLLASVKILHWLRSRV